MILWYTSGRSTLVYHLYEIRLHANGIIARSRPCYVMQFFWQLAMQFYFWEMYISEEFSKSMYKKKAVECNKHKNSVVTKFTSLKSRKFHRVTRPLVLHVQTLHFTENYNKKSKYNVHISHIHIFEFNDSYSLKRSFTSIQLNASRIDIEKV